MFNELLETLSRTECDELLGRSTYGRVVYTDRAMPACTPVNYAIDAGSVVFRTVLGSRLAGATDHHVVAFQVDEIDPVTGSGFTVLVTGSAAPISAPAQLQRVEKLGLPTWAWGELQHWVRLSPVFVTGRRLQAHPGLDGMPQSLSHLGAS